MLNENYPDCAKLDCLYILYEELEVQASGKLWVFYDIARTINI